MISAKLETSFDVRGNPIQSYFSFPEWTEDTEKTINEITEWLQKQPNFKFKLSVESVK